MEEYCSGCDTCKILEGKNNNQPASEVKGGWLIFASILVFILPFILSIVGAIVCGKNQFMQFLGALGGFFCGVFASVIMSRFFIITVKETDD